MMRPMRAISFCEIRLVAKARVLGGVDAFYLQFDSLLCKRIEFLDDKPAQQKEYDDEREHKHHPLAESDAQIEALRRQLFEHRSEEGEHHCSSGSVGHEHRE